jgi:hypothetical protein
VRLSRSAVSSPAKRVFVRLAAREEGQVLVRLVLTGTSTSHACHPSFCAVSPGAIAGRK